MSKLLAGDKENIRDRNQPTRLLSAGDNSLKALGLSGLRRELAPSVQDKSARGIAKPTTVGKTAPQASIQGLVQGGIIPYHRKVVKPAGKQEEPKDTLTKLRIGQVTSNGLGLISSAAQKPSSHTSIPAQSTSTTRYQSKPKARKPEESQNVLLEHKQSLLGSFHKAFPQAALVTGANKSVAVRRAKENHDQSSISNTSEVSEVSRQKRGDGKHNGASGEQLQTLTYKSTEATLVSLHVPGQGESILTNNAPTTKQKKLTTYNPAVLKKIGAFQIGATGAQRNHQDLLPQYHSGPSTTGNNVIGYLKESNGGDIKYVQGGDKPKVGLGGLAGIVTTIKSKNSMSLANTDLSYGVSNNAAQQPKGVLVPSKVGNDSLLCNENMPKYEILGGHIQMNPRGVSNDPRALGDKLFGGLHYESATQRLAAAKNFNPLQIKQKQLTPEEEIAAFEMKLKIDFGSPLPQTIQNLMKVEAEYSPDPYYLDKYHTEITWLERAILLDWLAEVSVFFVLKNSTYYLTVNYIDRYMTEVKNVEKSQFQLVGITALLIATKVEEIYVRPIAFLKDIAHNQFSTEAIMAMEITMMKVATFNPRS